MSKSWKKELIILRIILHIPTFCYFRFICNCTFCLKLRRKLIFILFSVLESIQKFRLLKKSAHLVLMTSLEKAVWNWMDTYPHEFADLQVFNNG